MITRGLPRDVSLSTDMSSAFDAAVDRARAARRSYIRTDDLLIALLSVTPAADGVSLLTKEFGITSDQVSTVVDELKERTLTSSVPDPDAMALLVEKLTGEVRQMPADAEVMLESDATWTLMKARDISRDVRYGRDHAARGYDAAESGKALPVEVGTDHFLRALTELSYHYEYENQRGLGSAVLAGFVDAPTFAHRLYVEMTRDYKAQPPGLE